MPIARPTDEEICDEIEKNLQRTFAPFAQVMEDSLKNGFVVSINFGPTPEGKIVLHRIEIMKKLRG